MRRSLTRLAVTVLAVALPLTTVLAGEASAARHRHRRNHFHRSPNCPSDFQAVHGVCQPVPPIPPPSHSIGNVAMSPNSATMTMTGTSPPVGDWNQANIVVTGLPPNAVVTVSSPSLASACAPGTGQVNLVTPNDATGRLTFNAAGTKCPAGSYAVNFTETASPNQTFTAFMNLHF